jgi:chromosome partitioning protein
VQQEPSGHGPAEIVACVSQKGGVGKTTTAVSLAAYLALAGQRVLLVDLDPQGNATLGFGIERTDEEGSIYEPILSGADARPRIRPTAIPGCHVIPSSPGLVGAEVELVGIDARERRLAAALSPLRPDFDYVILDCSPSLGMLTINALTAADSLLVPVQCEFYALDALGRLQDTIQLVRDHLNPRLAVKGVLLTMFDARTSLSAGVAADVRTYFGDKVFRTAIPRSVRLAEAPSHEQPIALYSPTSSGARAYEDLAHEILRRDGRSTTPVAA